MVIAVVKVVSKHSGGSDCIGGGGHGDDGSRGGCGDFGVVEAVMIMAVVWWKQCGLWWRRRQK